VELGKKKARMISWAIMIPLTAVLIALSWADRLDSSWTLPLFMLCSIIAAGIVKFIQKRVDPEAYKAELKEYEAEEKAEEEIRRIKIKRTWGGSICEFITAMVLIVSWILILRDHPSLASDGEGLKIAGLCTVGAIWFHVSAYFHNTMGYPSSTVNQLKMCIYRKRALGILCAVFLICGFLIPDGSKVGEWFVIVMGLSFVLLFSSKFCMGYVK
jgi:hypothetical protein